MKLFVIPIIKETPYLHGIKIRNNPVNAFQCKEVIPSTYQCYPDNIGLPAITFFGCNAQWVFGAEDEELRDIEIRRITEKDY